MTFFETTPGCTAHVFPFRYNWVVGTCKIHNKQYLPFLSNSACECGLFEERDKDVSEKTFCRGENLPSQAIHIAHHPIGTRYRHLAIFLFQKGSYHEYSSAEASRSLV